MAIYCLPCFKTEYEKLIKNNSYAELTPLLINYLFDTPIELINQGTRLNNSQTRPFIKKRLNGKGGFRLYYLMLLVDDKVYLSYIHPKTGKYGLPTLQPKQITVLMALTNTSILNKNVYQLIKNNKTIDFKKVDY